MSEHVCQTVRVHFPAAPDGFAIINESDFDPTVHVLFDGTANPVNPAAGAIQADAAPIPAKRPRGRPRRVSEETP